MHQSLSPKPRRQHLFLSLICWVSFAFTAAGAPQNRRQPQALPVFQVKAVDAKGKPLPNIILGKRWIITSTNPALKYPKMQGQRPGDLLTTNAQGIAQLSIKQVLGKRGKRAIIIGVSHDYRQMGICIIQRNNIGPSPILLTMRQAAWVNITVQTQNLPHYLAPSHKVRIRALYGKLKALGVDLLTQNRPGNPPQKTTLTSTKILLPIGDVTLDFSSHYEISQLEQLRVKPTRTAISVKLSLTPQMRLIGHKINPLIQNAQLITPKHSKKSNQKQATKKNNHPWLLCFVDFKTLSSQKLLAFALAYQQANKQAVLHKAKIIIFCKAAGPNLQAKIKAQRIALLGNKPWPFPIYIDHPPATHPNRSKLGRVFNQFFVTRMGTAVLIDAKGKVAGYLPNSQAGRKTMLQAVCNQK